MSPLLANRNYTEQLLVVSATAERYEINTGIHRPRMSVRSPFTRSVYNGVLAVGAERLLPLLQTKTHSMLALKLTRIVGTDRASAGSDMK
jgi:hypothetical protein